MANNTNRSSLINYLTGSNGLGRNYIKNPSAFKNTSDITETGSGVLSRNLSSPLTAISDIQYTTGAINDYISFSTYTLDNAEKGQNCEFKGDYKLTLGTSAVVHAQVYQGLNKAAELQLVTSTDSKQFRINYPCGDPASATTVRFTQTGSSDPSTLNVANLFLGKATNIGNVQQAVHYGALRWATNANCLWTQSADTYTTYPVDADCPTPTAKGNASAPSTKIPAIKFASLPAGEFMIVATGNFYKSGGTTASAAFRIWDGTTASDQEGMVRADTSNVWPTIQWRFSNTTARTNVTFEIQSIDISQNAESNFIDVREVPFNIDVYYFPSAQSQVVDVSNGPWFASGEIVGSQIVLSTSAVASPTEISQTDLVLTKDTGSAPVGIACSSTNDNTVGSTTCSAGNEVPGFIVDIPRAGDYEVCINLPHRLTPAASTTADYIHLFAEVTNATSTIIQRNIKLVKTIQNTGSGEHTLRNQMGGCGIFNFSSIGKKTFKSFYLFSKTGTVNDNTVPISSASSSNDTATGPFKFSIKPVVQAHQVTVVDQIVTKGANQAFNFVSAEIQGTGTPAILTEYGAWIDSITDNGTGDYVLNFTSGAFSAKPICTANAVPGFGRIMSFASSSTTSINVRVANDGGNVEDINFYIQCHGPR